MPGVRIEIRNDSGSIVSADSREATAEQVATARDLANDITNDVANGKPAT